MKRLILYCFIFISGSIGSIGWIIACAASAHGGQNVVISCVRNPIDWIIIIFFVIIAIIGLICSINECNR